MAVRVARSIAALLALPEDQRHLGVYRLVRPLGKGGFAPVWLAKEAYGGVELRTVAVKLFALDDGVSRVGGPGGITQIAARQALRDRIVAEARALCQVEHPNIVRFFAIATDAPGNVLGLAMEYVHGTPLDAKLADSGKLPLGEALALGCAVASALSAVHQVGLVHRDIKPANVIDAAGVYKVIDFGIAAGRELAANADAKRGTPSQVVVDDLPIEVEPRNEPPLELAATQQADSLAASGTTGYVDPACLSSAAPAALVSPASDLYSLGAMLYECITGDVPAIASAKRKGAGGFDPDVLNGRARAPRIESEDVPEALATIVGELLDPDPLARPRSAEAVAWELERIRRAIAGRSRPLPPEDKGPFRGLGRFEESDRDVYFGRSIEIAGALEMIRARGLVALVGPSGSGKSSLARAGLLPAICDGDLGGWPKRYDGVIVVPGEDPRAQIGAALERFVPGASTREPEALVAALAEYVQREQRGIVLLVDQLEELVTMSGEESRAWSVRLLARLGAQAIGGVRCIVAARRDLLDSILAIGELGRVIARGTLLVAPLTDAAWEEVIDSALSAYGFRLEDDAMRAELLEQLKGTSSAMPLVQFALTELWRRRDPDKKIIPHAALRDIGGIGGALEMHADATLASLTRVSPEAQKTARDLLLELTTPQGTRATRPLADLEKRVPSPWTDRVAAELEEARLLAREADGITIAHEALLARWGELRRWIGEARGDRLRAEEIEREAEAWIADKRSPDRLLKGRRLEAGEELAAKNARLLGDGARDLIVQSRRAQRRARATALAPVAVIALAAAGWAFARWDASRVKTSYCGNSVSRWQAPVCLAPVDDAQRAHRPITQRFKTQYGRVIQVDRINAQGELREDDDGYASWSYRYDDEGRVAEITYADHMRAVKMREVFTDNLRRRERRDRFGTPKPIPGTDATVTTLDYDERGFVTRLRFSNLYGSPRVDDAHAFGYAMKVDARGLALQVLVLGHDGTPSPNGEGIVRVVKKYDDRGNVVEATFLDLEEKPALLAVRYSSYRAKLDANDAEIERAFFDTAGNPATTKWGYARATYAYDDRGNRTKIEFYDADGKPTLTNDGGYAGLRVTFDAKGNEIETEYFGTDEQPIVTKQGFVRATAAYDDHGNVVEMHYSDLDGKPAAHVDGEASWKKSYDDRANEIEGSYFGTGGEPVMVGSYARWKATYDERDNPVEVMLFGIDGKPVLGADGYAKRISSYDDRGKEISTQFFGPDGAPILKTGYAKSVMRYDDHGNLVETRYFGLNGKPVLRQGGYATVTSRYDDRGNKIEDAYFGISGNAVLSDASYARRTLKWDDRGKQIEEAFFGTDDKPLLVGGFARWTATYEARGSEIERRYFGVDDRPITHPDGYSWQRSSYDDRGNLIERAFFAVNDKPTLLKDGTAGWRSKFDDQNNEIEKVFVGLAGAPARGSTGFAKTTAKYDRQGNETERAFFDVEGRPTMAKGGFHRTIATYDPRGKELERRWFDTEGKPIKKDGAARALSTYDARGKETEIRFFGIDDEPVVAKDGYARRTSKYDDRGDQIEEAYFDAKDAPITNKDGIAMWRAVFDKRGRPVEKSYFGVDGKPAAPEGESYARMTSVLDDRSLEIERAYFAPDGKPVLKDGAARWTSTYDGNGQRTESRYFGIDGKPIVTRDGYARIVQSFDVYGHVLTSEVFDDKGARALHAEGWSRFVAKFDEIGNEIEKTYFGPNDKPIAIKKGYARTAARYDDAGRELEREYFGTDDRAVSADGFARSLSKYDEHGNLLEQAWFGEDGRPVMKAGYARRVAKVDRQGQEIEIAYFGAAGQLVMNGDFARWQGRYDERGKAIESAFFGPSGQSTAGAPIVLADGYARFTKSYDDAGRHVETRYFGKDGKLGKQRDGVAIVRRTYDDWGNEIERAFFDESDRPTLHREGVAGWRSKFDAFGHEIERAFFGKDGKLARLKTDGYARWWASKIDSDGNELETQFFDENDNPVATSAGYARVTAKYDERSSRIVVVLNEEALIVGTLRKDDAVTWPSKLGVYGTPIELSYFGKNGLPVVAKDGYAMVTFKYDLSGNLVEKAFVDTTGAPIVDKKSGCATIRFSYDDGGKIGERTCRDASGKVLKR